MSLESDNDALSGPQPATRVRLPSVEECLDRVEVTYFQRDYCPTLQQLLSYTDESLQKYCNTAVKGDLSHLLKLAVAALRSSIYVKHSLRNICDNLQRSVTQSKNLIINLIIKLKTVLFLLLLLSPWMAESLALLPVLW